MTVPPELNALMAQMDQDVAILVLVQGTLPDGSAHYAYASIPPSRYAAFKQAEAAGNYDLAQYGAILAHGAGTPTAEMQRRMEAEYGVNHRFESDMAGLMREFKNAAGG